MDAGKGLLEANPKPAEKIRVLLIEDNPDDADYIREILSTDAHACFELDRVERLEEGLKRHLTEFDAVLLDLSLPDCIGLETLDRFRKANPTVPVVVLTGLDDERTGLQSIRRGAQDYLVKSRVFPDLLSRAIRYAIQRARMDRMKDEFISILSHEIRGPITVIHGASETLQAAAADPHASRQREFLDMIRRNTERLNRTVTNVLSISRLESGRATLNRRRLQAAAVLAEACVSALPEADRRGIRIHSETATTAPDLYADPDLIAEVLSNLIGNALRFAKANIWIAADAFSGRVDLSVTDDGDGIPDGKTDQLFNKYVQVVRVKSRGGYKGTGLGLAICKLIVELHGGKIRAENTASAGAAFHVVLPAYDENAVLEQTLRDAVDDTRLRNDPLTLLTLTARNGAEIKAAIGDRLVGAFERVYDEKIASLLRQEDRMVRRRDRLFILLTSRRSGAELALERIRMYAAGPFKIAGRMTPEVSVSAEILGFPEDVRDPADLVSRVLGGIDFKKEPLGG